MTEALKVMPFGVPRQVRSISACHDAENGAAETDAFWRLALEVSSAARFWDCSGGARGTTMGFAAGRYSRGAVSSANGCMAMRSLATRTMGLRSLTLVKKWRMPWWIRHVRFAKFLRPHVPNNGRSSERKVCSDWAPNEERAYVDCLYLRKAFFWLIVKIIWHV